MKQKKIYIAIADSFPASTMNVVPFTTRKKAAAHVIERIRKYIEGTPWNPDHWTGYGKTGEHHIDAMHSIDFGMDDVIVYNDLVETSAIFGIAVRNMDDPANAEFGVSKSPADSAVDSLARTLWAGMYDSHHKVTDDRDAAIAYIRAMFPGVDNIWPGDARAYFDYDGVKYFIMPEYSLDENENVQYGKITVRDYDGTWEYITIDRDTRDVKGTLEKFFKKAKSAVDSPDSRDSPDSPVEPSLEDRVAKSAGDSPDSPVEPSLEDRVAKLEAVVKTLNDEIKKIKKIIRK